MKKLTLIMGGPKVDHSQEVNLQFGKLISRAAYFKKKKEYKEIKSLYVEYAIHSEEHLVLLELFKQYSSIMELGDVPFQFIGEYIGKIDSFLEKESNKFKKAR
jgi:hypothetical protein